MNIFFHIKRVKLLAMKITVLTFMIKVFFFFTEDEPVLSQPSQAILAPYDNAENNNTNNCESDIMKFLFRITPCA